MIVGAQRIDSRPRFVLGYLSLGAVPAWRPELLPACVAIAAISLRSGGVSSPREWARSIAVLLGPVLTVALARWLLFGAALPLSSVAKAPDPRSGMFYAGNDDYLGRCALAPCRPESVVARPPTLAFVWCAHLLAVLYAGGDWMPALRLTAPLLPWIVWTVGRSAQVRWPLLLSVVPALVAPWTLLWEQGHDFRAVAERRLALVEAGGPALEGAQVVAATDVGWVGLATDARVIDLAGVTDPTIAPLPGGHTSKAIYPGLFSDRNVDAWVIRAADRGYSLGDPLWTVVPVYAVDARLLGRSGDLGLVATAIIPLEGTQGPVCDRATIRCGDGIPQGMKGLISV